MSEQDQQGHGGLAEDLIGLPEPIKNLFSRLSGACWRG